MFAWQAVRLLESEGSGGREGGGGAQDAQSEVLSTSTISRADDSQRMKELEDTFEERYMRVTRPPLSPLTTSFKLFLGDAFYSRNQSNCLFIVSPNSC